MSLYDDDFLVRQNTGPDIENDSFLEEETFKRI